MLTIGLPSYSVARAQAANRPITATSNGNPWSFLGSTNGGVSKSSNLYVGLLKGNLCNSWTCSMPPMATQRESPFYREKDKILKNVSQPRAATCQCFAGLAKSARAIQRPLSHCAFSSGSNSQPIWSNDQSGYVWFGLQKPGWENSLRLPSNLPSFPRLSRRERRCSMMCYISRVFNTYSKKQ